MEKTQQYTLGNLINATKDLCDRILQVKNKGYQTIDIDEIDFSYEDMINDCEYVLENLNSIISKINKLKDIVDTL